MKRKIMSMIAAVAILAGSTGAVYAYFSTTLTSVNNVFASGKMEMQLSKDNTTFTETVSAAFGGTGLMPGTCLQPGTLYIKNTGTVNGNHIDLTANNTNVSLASYLKLDTITYDGIGVTVTDANSNGFVDLDDLKTSGAHNLALTDKNIAHPLVMKLCLDSSATNAQQEQTNTMELSVVLDQGPH
ncbi:MAG: hypothetical protein RI947_417 [Candidatus Parcubacteria bacterium]|jgi:predicted ribosomally synthesized peptide with SipW-like signal peptide